MNTCDLCGYTGADVADDGEFRWCRSRAACQVRRQADTQRTAAIVAAAREWVAAAREWEEAHRPYVGMLAVSDDPAAIVAAERRLNAAEDALLAAVEAAR